MKRARIGNRLARRAQVGFGDDLEKRRARAIQVDTGIAVKILMERFACVFLEVSAGEPDCALAGCAVLFPCNGELAPRHHRRLVLADLIALG